jgi:hypothetical protein
MEADTSAQSPRLSHHNVPRILSVDEYKARNSRILPIYKNTLFEMLKKDSQRRISLAEVLRRLELQHTIAPAELQSQSSRSTRREP